jgi:hypothetical protein
VEVVECGGGMIFAVVECGGGIIFAVVECGGGGGVRRSEGMRVRNDVTH